MTKSFSEIVKNHIDLNKKYGITEEIYQSILIGEIKIKCNKVCELPSKKGKKWVIPLEILDKIAMFHTDKVDSYQDCPGTLYLPGLELEFLVRNMRLADMSFITVDGVGGYIGLSANHNDGWHIGTPNFALSKPLIKAMECLMQNAN